MNDTRLNILKGATYLQTVLFGLVPVVEGSGRDINWLRDNGFLRRGGQRGRWYMTDKGVDAVLASAGLTG